LIKRALRKTIALTATAVVGLGFVAPAVALAAAQSTVAPVYAVTPRRIAASTAVVVGLIGAVIGGLALARSVRRIGNRGRRGAIVALVLGPISLVSGGLVVVTAEGGVGTGNGVAGAVVAMVVGLIGMTLGGLTLARSRRIG
jgi:FtsH-binding integral membrane protein